MPSVMKHDFSRVPHANIPRSKFNRSCGYKTTFDFGKLIPVFCDEVYPGDTFNLKMSAFGRLATPINPVMDNMNLDTFFFFVPNRLVWDNWEKFNGAQDNPGDSTDYLVPKVNCPVGGFNEGTTADYFGIPTQVNLGSGSSAIVNALPFRALNLIYNEWFRDENLVNSLPVPKDDGPDDWTTDYSNGGLINRGKRHDYFTSCLPWPQKGDAVSLPLGSTADMIVESGSGTGDEIIAELGSGGLLVNFNAATAALQVGSTPGVTTAKLQADLSTATAATINDLREAFQVQKLLEKDARGGTRYTEIVKAHFGVNSPDARLQRPEYLGGGTSNINISPIAQTSSTDATTPQGNLAAMGTVGIHNNGFNKSFTEHGYVIGIVCARADLTYQQGIDRMWLRDDRYDFYWPSLAHLGEQEVLSREIYADGTVADDDVFGYQERYAELRYKPSKVTSAFRSNAAASLDSWHLCQDFASRPVLGSTFIAENPPIDRIVAVPSEPDLIFDAYFDLVCARPIPMYSVPGLIDHF